MVGVRGGQTHISFSWWSLQASCWRLSSCCWASCSSREVRSSSRASSWLVSFSLVFSTVVSCLSLWRAVHWPSSWKGMGGENHCQAGQLRPHLASLLGGHGPCCYRSLPSSLSKHCPAASFTHTHLEAGGTSRASLISPLSPPSY